MTTATHTDTPTDTPTATDALAERIFSAAVASFDIAGIYLGDRMGWYRSLAEDGPATPEQLAARTDTDERYAREWLEQQAVSGILVLDDGGFALPDGHRDVLVGPESPSLMAPLTRMLVAAFGRLPAVADAYRSGAGVGWDSYGPDMREGQADFNRPAFTNLLGREWLPAVTAVHERLSADPPARVVDIGCGEGWSTLAISRAYPKAHVTGVDIDEPAIAAAWVHARETGANGNVSFVAADAAELTDSFDLAIIIEAVHDMANPVPVLDAARRSLAAGGSLIVVDERVAESFSAPGDDIERFMYGWSITTCLPDGRSRQPSVATGTVMRPDTLRRYAHEAGFASVEILPIENDFFRFYRLSA